MPSVSFDSLSFLFDGARSRASRFTIAAAAFDATLLDPLAWAATLSRLRHTGFNTVVIRVPWALHEPTPGRFVFTGACDLRRAIELAATAGLKVILRIGPCVGGSFARGGLPIWLRDLVGPRLREANPAFLARVSQFWRALAPQCVDLLASRNGASAIRAVIAVGIEDDWRSLDGALGDAYFAALVRFAREVGIDVPLFTANNCWYTHESLLDAWQGPTVVERTTRELRQVHPDAPPLLMHSPTRRELLTGGTEIGRAWAALIAESVASRADFACEVVGTRHTHATSATGCAERPDVDTFASRRALVFATSFAEIFAAMKPVSIDAGATHPRAAMHARAVHLAGERSERCTVVLGAAKDSGTPQAKRSPSKRTSTQQLSHRAADGSEQVVAAHSESAVDFYASDFVIAGARLERCTGSLVALLGDIVVVAGAPRTKIKVKVDGSAVELTVLAEGAAPKVTKVRGLRFAVVTHAMACGVGIAEDAIEFIDRAGVLLARVARDGSVESAEIPKATKAARGTKIERIKSSQISTSAVELKLAPPLVLAATRLVDGTDPRFARIASPASLGSYGLAAMHGFYRVRFDAPKRKGSDVRFISMGVRATYRVAEKKRSEMHVMEVCANALPPFGGHLDERVGVLGPLVECTAVKGVKSSLVELPDFDATTLGRFAWGYEPRGAMGARKTVQWTFAARKNSVMLRFPDWWRDEGHLRVGHRLRLNGELLDAELAEITEIMMDGAKLSPMRPAPVAKGEKPPKGRNIKLVPGENELLLDLDPHAALDDARLKRLAKEMDFVEVVGEINAEWSFARIEPPSSWSIAGSAAKRTKSSTTAKTTVGLPTWFRWTYPMAIVPTTVGAVELVVEHPADEIATILVNGVAAMTLDGVSGVRVGTAKRPYVRRTLQLSATQLRAGENEISAFSPSGVMPVVSIRINALMC